MINTTLHALTPARVVAGAALAAVVLLTPSAAAVQDRDDAASELRNRIRTVVDGDDDASARIGVWTDDKGLTYRDARSHSVEVMIENGDIKVRIDGQDVPADRIERKDGKVIVLDADGNELEMIHVGVMGHGGEDEGIGFRLGDGNRFRARLDRAGEPAELPKVMVGIHLGEPGPALLKHLNIEPGTTTMINALYEGLPAHDAGLDEFDIITRINGRAPASPKDLREALAGAEPGDVLRLAVIHAGEPRTVSIELEAYDREAMADARLIGRAESGGVGNIRVFGDGEGLILDGARDFSVELPEFDRFLLDGDNRLFEMLPREGMRMFEFERGQGGPHRFEIGGPTDPDAADADSDAGMRRIDRRLERLERLLSELLGEVDRKED